MVNSRPRARRSKSTKKGDEIRIALDCGNVISSSRKSVGERAGSGTDFEDVSEISDLARIVGKAVEHPVVDEKMLVNVRIATNPGASKQSVRISHFRAIDRRPV